MKTTVLGVKSSLQVCSIGLGCWGMVGAYQPVPEKKDMVRFTREAVEQGAVFLDTAEVYGPYTSEEIIGEALEGIRDQVVIATKFDKNDVRSGMPRFEKTEILEANWKIVEFVQKRAKEKGCTPAQFALAWLVAQRPWIVPIPGTTKQNRLKENLAADQVTFTDGEIQQINRELDQIQIIGARYNAQQESLLEK